MKTKSNINESFFKNAINNISFSKEREHLLLQISNYIAGEINKKNKVNLNFICTHNSRRSQLSQIWASYAIAYFSFKNTASFSGGTAVTAFHRNTVKTLQEVGFHFDLVDFSHQNPKYLITYENCKIPITGFSKIYDDEFNKTPFIAITTCSDAEEKCPFITDAKKRFHLPFVDPKKHDDTEHQSEKYLETNKQIAGEIGFIFTEVSKII